MGMAERQDTKEEKPLIFLSHKSEDAQLTQALREWVDETLLGAVRFFQSTNHESLSPGVVWFDSIKENLDCAAMMLVLVTGNNFASSWVFFEAGAAASRGIPLIPVCIRAKLSALPSPLNHYEGVDLDSDQGPIALLSRVSALANLRTPKEVPV